MYRIAPLAVALPAAPFAGLQGVERFLAVGGQENLYAEFHGKLLNRTGEDGRAKGASLPRRPATVSGAGPRRAEADRSIALAYTPAMNSPEQRLFMPGSGATPPALTGREPEQAVLGRCLADLAGGVSPPHDVVLTGPRGNGKTALLNWFKNTCEDRKLDVVALTPDEIPNRAALIAALSPRTWRSKLLPRKVDVAAVGSVEWAASAEAPDNLARRLIARCRKKAVVVLLDEAHTLAPEVGRALLNASQKVRGEAPFLLVLAGTPGLPAHLGTMNASFWDRLGAGLLGIGLLSDAAAREALIEPLTAHGTGIDGDALDAVIEDSQRYPYFIQIWGDALWERRLATGATRLTSAHVAEARPDVAAQVMNYHQRRYRELEAGGLLPAAAALIPVFQAGADATASDRDLDAALAATGADVAARLAAREALNRLGYVWCPPGQLPPITWSAGIPSLMTHVLDHAPVHPAP